MKNNIKIFASAALVAACGSVFTSCDDWTEPESVDINYGSIDKAENYPAYLASLREYRNSDHKKIYAWLDVPAEGPGNQSQRLTGLPDSVDVVVLVNPGNIHPQTKRDIDAVRADKGMEVVYSIDFDAIKVEYAALLEELSLERENFIAAEILRVEAEEGRVITADEVVIPAELEDPEFLDYVTDQTSEQLTYASKEGFDGVMFAFNGKATHHFTEAELAEYNAQANLFLGIAADWHKRFPQFKFDYIGYPQYVINKELLNEFNLLFIRQGLNATNINLYDYYLTMASVEGVPTEKLGMMTTYTSADPVDVTTGVFSDGSLAIVSMAHWAQTADIAAVGMQNVQNDYFTPDATYSVIRQAIQTINPCIK